MKTEIELLNYLKKFIISKEIFNINIKPRNIDILKDIMMIIIKGVYISYGR